MLLNVFMNISKKIHKLLYLIVLFLLQAAMVLQIEANAAQTGAKKDKGKNNADNSTVECIVKSEHGSINWTTGVVKAKGRNRAVKKERASETTDAMLIESATENAREHLFEILKSIAVSSNPAVDKKIFATQPEYHMVTAQIKKKASSAKLVKSYYISVLGQIVEVEVETKLYGDFLESVLPARIVEIPNIEFFELEGGSFQSAQNLTSNALYSNDRGSESNSESYSKNIKPYTGLVVDARGIKFKPVISPVIVSEQGEEIYSPLFISREYAVERGVCSYICSDDPAFIRKKAGSNPVTIKGLRKDADLDYYIVISMSDAEKIQKMAERHIFMKECSVVILVSP